MAEAEDVITDAARHATIFARGLWRRHRIASQKKHGHAQPPPPLLLADVAPRLDLLLTAAFGRGFPIRAAQPPAPPTVLARLLRRQRARAPYWRDAIGATDGYRLWLPPTLAAEAGAVGEAAATAHLRLLALRQAMRAMRLTGGSPESAVADVLATLAGASPLVRDLYLLFEAHVSDHALTQRLPGLYAGLSELRAQALAQRPSIDAFPVPTRRFEQLVRRVLGSALDRAPDLSECEIDSTAGGTSLGTRPPSAELLVLAQETAGSWPDAAAAARLAGPWLWRDQWTGDLKDSAVGSRAAPATAGGRATNDDATPPRTARLARRPDVRQESSTDEDDPNPGVWMVQTAAPHEKAEDPLGLQRPTDRDGETAADDFADALSELPEARLVSTPGTPKEVLLSDDPPEPNAATGRDASTVPSLEAQQCLNYPEWDWRVQAYRDPGATVWLLPAVLGPQQWVDDTLAERRGMLHEIRRRFELLSAQRVRLQRQFDGDTIDLAAYVDARAQFDAGLPLDQRLYSTERRSRRDLAVLLLVDASGSTDSQIAAGQRIIDVEREALLLVCSALDGLRAPYSVQAFSGEGPQHVVVRSIKSFAEHDGAVVAQRIAGLEPERYTRTGAALRHATALLSAQPAEHRLLLLLSDGKPNDSDAYEGRYGVEDLRQAVVEARLQGVAPFCLTVDRQAAAYLPAVFGPHHYALLQRPERLPTVLLDWLRRLVQH